MAGAAGGFLTGKYRRDQLQGSGDGCITKDNLFGDPKFTDRNWEVLEVLTDVANDLDRPAAEVATAWILGRPGVDTVLAGARTVDQLDTSLKAFERSLTVEALDKLDAISTPDLGNGLV